MAADGFYASVREVVLERWPSVQEVVPPDEDGGRRFLFGRFGDIEMELTTIVAGEMPVVRVTSQLARFVPRSRSLIERLNNLNQNAIGTTLGMTSEGEPSNTVRVVVAAAAFGDFIDPETVRTAVEASVWTANVLLQQGFLTTYGGELAMLVQLRAMINASRLLSESQREPALSGLVSVAADLEARLQAGDVGRLPTM